MRILNADEMRDVDRAAIEDWGFSGLLLMENAALGVVEAIAARFAEVDSATIFCGPGNNGGDGLAIARHLDLRGYRVQIVLAGWSANKSSDAAWQLEICSRQGISIIEVKQVSELPVPKCTTSGLWIDALFGTGLGRPLAGLFGDLVEALALAPCPVVAVDLPSGLDASSGELSGPSSRADLTVTFAAPKWPHVFAPASERCGELVVADLGIPPAILEQTPGNLYLMVPEELRSLMLVRPESSHKGDFGHCLIVAGSPGMSGAAVLATQAAVAAGAGLVTVAVPTDLLVTLECASLESMSLGLSSDPSGHLALAAAPEVLTALESRDVLALGPGLGRSPETVAAAREIVASSACPAVIDADGLYALVGASELLLARGGTTVLTPHPGEAARLAGSSVEEIEADRIGFARRMAVEWNSVLVLKGHQTLVATPDGAVHVNTSGNPGMASGGCGDVLTGIVVALLAQGYSGEIAAILGVYLHGLAGDLALESRGEEGLRAGDLVEMLPQAFDSLRNA